MDNIQTKPKLICMVGLHGSGKTTVAKELVAKNPNMVIVSSDDIRCEICNGNVADMSKNDEVFTIYYKRIKRYLEEGHDVIADATNLTMKSRRGLLDYIAKIDCEKIALIISKEFQNCIKDNSSREKSVPEEVLHNMIRIFQVPFKEEGFDRIKHKIIEQYPNYVPLNGDYSGPDKRPISRPGYNIHRCYRAMEDFNQRNPHHVDTLDIHCEKVTTRFIERIMTLDMPKKTLFSYVMGARYHDIGKIDTQTFDEEGISHYYNHPNVGAYHALTCGILSLDTIFLINYHMMPFNWSNDRTREKYKKIFGEEKYNILMMFHECDKER